MRRFGIALLLFAVVLTVVGPSAPQSQQQPVVIKFSPVVAKEAPKGKAADRFAELVNQRLKGRVEVQVFHNSALYKDREEIEALQLGAVQMLAPSTAKLVPWFPPVPGVRSAVPLRGSGARLPRHDRSACDGQALPAAQEPADAGPRGLGQRVEAHDLQQVPRRQARGPEGPEDPGAVLQGAGGTVPCGRRHPAGDGLRRGLQRARAWGGGRRGEHAHQQVLAKDARGPEVPHDQLPRLHRVRGADQRRVLGRPAPGHPQGPGGPRAEVTKWQWDLNAKEQEEAFKKVQKDAKATGKFQISVLTPEQRAQWATAFSPVQKKFDSQIGRDLLDLVSTLAK